MKTLDASEETGCCWRFNPDFWQEKEIGFHDKLFLKESYTHSQLLYNRSAN